MNRILWIVLLPWLVWMTALAEETSPVEAPKPLVPSHLHSPRATMTTFVESMTAVRKGDKERFPRALETLDLSQINPLVVREAGQRLAWLLWEVLEQTERFDSSVVPSATTQDIYLYHQYESGAVEIELQRDGRWLFSATTLDGVEAIWEELQATATERGVTATPENEQFLPLYLRLRNQLPPALTHKWLTLEGWQWLGIFLFIVLGVAADRLVTALFALLVKGLRKRAGGYYADVDSQVLRPWGLMAMAAVWWLGLNHMGLPEDVLLVLLVAAKFLASLSGVWGAYRFVDLITAYLLQQAVRTETRLDDMLVPLFGRALKLFVTVAGLVFLAASLNVNLTGLLAGLGLGGIAFALAAKDTVENVFGSIMVITDHPFVVGDWVVIGDIEGTVEAIGFRSTRIRTFYNSLVTLPNSKLITANIDNMGQRQYRRFKCMLSLAYETPPERIESFCAGLREIVQTHPNTRKDYCLIYLNQAAAASLDVLVYIYFDVPNWQLELEARHYFLLDALRLADRLGVSYAYPTQTVYWKKAPDDPQPQTTTAFEMPLNHKDAQILGAREADKISRLTMPRE